MIRKLTNFSLQFNFSILNGLKIRDDVLILSLEEEFPFISRWSNNLWLGLFFLGSTSLQERTQISNSHTTLLPLHI